LDIRNQVKLDLHTQTHTHTPIRANFVEFRASTFHHAAFISTSVFTFILKSFYLIY